ncbi:MAG TPA: acyloxyacyl hydrolase [Fimbriimonadaceae bacterium]|nr:acyloxyacyl hydrolase [Fimbriimonadaceae bacterium]
MRGKASIVVAALTISGSQALAQGLYTRPERYFSFFGGHSARILGSQDIRTDYGFGIAWAKPEPHFKWRHGPTQLVIEAYYEHSNGQQYPTRGKVTEAIGAIWYARFRFPSKVVNLYADIGEGAQLSNSESFDLGTRLNSSPMIGFGVTIRQGSQETLVGFRILHLSNAGLNRDNRGQNQILFYASVKF